MAKRGPDGTGRAVKHREGSIIGMVTRLHLDACYRIAQQVARKFPRSAFARRTRDGQGGAHVRWTLRQQRLGPGAS